MRRAAIIALCLLTGCGTARRAVKSDTQTRRETAAAVRIRTDSTVSTAAESRTALAQNEEVTTRVVEFDTARPADSATGLPPVRRIIRQTHRTVSALRHETRSDTAAAVRRAVDTAAVRRETTDTRTHERTRRGLNLWQRIACIASAAALLWLLARAGRLFRKG